MGKFLTPYPTPLHTAYLSLSGNQHRCTEQASHSTHVRVSYIRWMVAGLPRSWVDSAFLSGQKHKQLVPGKTSGATS